LEAVPFGDARKRIDRFCRAGPPRARKEWPNTRLRARNVKPPLRQGGICEIGLTLHANGVILHCFQTGTDSLFVQYGSDGTREEGPPG
jgi:hypothetical protein